MLCLWSSYPRDVHYGWNQHFNYKEAPIIGAILLAAMKNLKILSRVHDTWSSRTAVLGTKWKKMKIVRSCEFSKHNVHEYFQSSIWNDQKGSKISIMSQRLLGGVCFIVEKQNWWKDIAVQVEPVCPIPNDMFCKCHTCWRYYIIHIYRFGIGLQSSFIRVVCSYIKFYWTEYVRR